MTSLNTFFAKRDAPSAKFRCGCCGDVLHREDHMGDAFTETQTAAVIVAYGPEVCFECAVFHPVETECGYCGRTSCTCDDAYEARVSDDLHEEYDA